MREKSKRLICLLSALVLLCSCSRGGPSSGVPGDSSAPPVSAPQSSSGEPDDPFVPYDVTDPDHLAQFWGDYMADLTSSAINGFASPSDIGYDQLSSYCATRMLNNNEPGVESVSSSSFRFPLELLLEYMDRYFDLRPERDDVVDFLGDRYDPNTGTYTDFVYLIPYAYDAGPLRLTSLRRETEDTLAAVVVRMSSMSDDAFVEKEARVTLREREDGSMFFVSSDSQWIKTENLSLQGRCIRVPESESEQFGDCVYWYPMGAGLLGVACRQDPNRFFVSSFDLVLFDTQDARVTARSSVSASERGFFTGAQVFDDRIILRTDHEYFVLDGALSLISSAPLPDYLSGTAKENLLLTRDLSQVIYSDDAGCWITPSDRKEPALLVSHPVPPDVGTDPYLLNAEIYLPVGLVDGGKSVLLSHAGYEFNLGYLLCPLDGSEPKRIDVCSDYGSVFSFDDASMTILGGYESAGETYTPRSIYLTFADGAAADVSNWPKESELESAYIVSGHYVWYFDLIKDGGSEKYGYSSAKLMRFDVLEPSMEKSLEDMDFKVEGFSYVEFLGADRDGRLLIRAQYNGEEATCIVSR